MVVCFRAIALFVILPTVLKKNYMNVAW